MENKIYDLLEKVYVELKETKNDVSTLKSDVSTLKSDVSTLKSDVSTLKSDVSSLKSDVSSLKSDVSTIKSTIIRHENEMHNKFGILFDAQKATNERLDRIELKVDDLSEKVDRHDIKIQVIEGGKRKKSVSNMKAMGK